MADSKWIIMCIFLLNVLCNCQERSLLNLEETGIFSCPSDNFMAVTADIVRVQAGEPDIGICLDPDHMSNTFPFYYTVSCESKNSLLSRQLLMSRQDIQLFQGLGGGFCLESRSSSDGNDQLLLGINLADVSPEKQNFSLTLVCRGVGTPGSGGSAVETSALIEPRNTTSLSFIPQGQNGNVTTEKGKRVKIAVLVALPDELENVTTLWSDSRIVCGPDADVEVPKCVYTSKVGIQVTWSCSITTNESDVYTFQHRGELYVVHLTVLDSNSTDPSPSSPGNITASIVLAVMACVLISTEIFIIVLCCCKRKQPDKQPDKQLVRQNAEEGRLDIRFKPIQRHDHTRIVESPDWPSSPNNNVIKETVKEHVKSMEVDEEITMEKNSAYYSTESFTRFDEPIQAESRLEDRQSDTRPMVHSEVEMSGVMITHPQTRTDTTPAITSWESQTNQSIGKCKTSSKTDTQQPSSTVRSGSTGSSGSSDSTTGSTGSSGSTTGSTCSSGSAGSTGSSSNTGSTASTGSISGGSSITPVTSDKWWILGGAHIIVVTSRGGEWSLSPFTGKRCREACCAVLTAPSGVVEEGVELLVEYCVVLDGPFTLPSNCVRVSVAVYLNCDETLLRKPLKLKLHHWAAPDEENDSHFSERLSFLKAPHVVAEGQDSHHFEPIEGAEFHTSTSTGFLSLKDHFCLICIACEESGPQEERVNKSCYAMLWEGEVEDSKQQFRIVVMYAVPSWIEATREYYLSERKGRLKYSEVREFVFTKDCVLHLGIAEDKGKDWMLLQLKTMLCQEDLSLSNFAEMECKDKIHKLVCGLYPPAMIFDVGYGLPPSKKSHRKYSIASLCGVKNEMNFSFPVLENPTMCSCSAKQREFYGPSKKRKFGSDISKKYQLDPVRLEDYVIPKMADKWKEFGIRLGIQNAMLDSIFQSNFGNTVNCCRAVLDYWMSSSSLEVSWDKVIQAMKDCERKLQASELEEHLSEPGSMQESLSSEFEE